MYVWVKSFHLIFMVTWFAGLFYVPRLFVYHANADDEVSNERFKVMERKLFYGITTPGGVLTVFFGSWLVALRGFEWATSTTWFTVKMILVTVLLAYHGYIGYLVAQFKRDQNRHSHVYYRFLNEFPVFLLVGIIILAIVKPSF